MEDRIIGLIVGVIAFLLIALLGVLLWKVYKYHHGSRNAAFLALIFKKGPQPPSAGKCECCQKCDVNADVKKTENMKRFENTCHTNRCCQKCDVKVKEEEKQYNANVDKERKVWHTNGVLDEDKRYTIVKMTGPGEMPSNDVTKRTHTIESPVRKSADNYSFIDLND
ncbi:uncharacterized protein LOC127873255 [Dreissena polymorpha]|uniref:Uncharacterized protein n=1 Tax=Dreissena polymorpha TaxID=45954 RepID=A0A9D4RTH6_DREPO|nr:uncharacterized protein LOC127873255 [Dreissena polymorpha]KAH3878042.1 hypothetical protein DPMN_001922 [Dreissena polymorpha]